jgi:archaellin
MTYSTTTAANGSATFNVAALRDADGSFTSTTPVINSGDLVTITIAPGTTVGMGPRSPYKFQLIPETGTPVIKEGVTPSSYGVDRYITLE